MPQPTPNHAAADRNLLFGILARIYDRKNRGYLLVVQVTGVAPAKASSE